MSGYYPYLLCGLPELHFDMDLSGFSYGEILDQVRELLTPADNRTLDLFLAFGSHEELAKDYLALQDEEQKAEYLREHDLPAYQRKIFARSLSVLMYGEEDLKVDDTHEDIERALVRVFDNAFYEAALKHRNPFLRKWFAFDGILKNTLVAFAARKQGRSPEAEFVQAASAPLIEWIKEDMNEGDFGLKMRLSYAQELFAALDLPDVFERERAIDRFRWQMASEIAAGKDFQLDKVLCYMLQAGILHRWQKMDPESGREYLREAVSEMRKVNLQGEDA
ncbi:MAG: DUF2764 domain-containing protein [Bacteroides sp.]|nr:DUF2764 domain-containing protein [Bacteroides sp.]